MKHYAIGDVHGEFDTLIELTNQLSKKAKFIFVGDLIDRGPDSSKVVDFVRNGNHQCVMGNHEDMMIKEAKRMAEMQEDYTIDELWIVNGGLSTLESYGVIKIAEDGNSFSHTKDKESINKFIYDAEWMESLPLYITATVRWKEQDADIIVSHAAIGQVWTTKMGKGSRHKEHILWNREQVGPFQTFQMLNVFGHTPSTYDMRISERKNWINIDSGCTYNRPGLGKLTALNLKTLKTILVDRI